MQPIERATLMSVTWIGITVCPLQHGWKISDAKTMPATAKKLLETI
jgi:hypothetical protein